MGYRHIDNLYKKQLVLIFKELYALEKINGTSANIKWKDGNITFNSGGASHNNFLTIFDEIELKKKFEELGHQDVKIYGEAYGGSVQKKSDVYGPDLKFIVFEIKINEIILNVPDAHDVANKLDLEFVDYKIIPATLEAIDAERDRESIQAIRNGMGNGKKREGIVLRPLEELRDKNGDVVISKHKTDEERETKEPRKVDDLDKLKVLKDAEAIAFEWITDRRLDHVLDKIEGVIDITRTGDVVKAMIEDVLREGKGEIVDSKEAQKAIGRVTAKLFTNRIKEDFRKSNEKNN